MYNPTLAFVFVLSLLVPSLPYADAELLPRQAGANGATAQLSLLSLPASTDSGMSTSTMTGSMATTTMTGSMSSSVPASVAASISNSMASASASVAASMASSLATNAATGGGGGSGAQGVVGTSAAGERVGVSWAWVGALMAVMGAAAAL